MREGSVDSKAYCIRRILEAISDSKVNFAVRTMKPNNCRSKNVKKNSKIGREGHPLLPSRFFLIT